MNDWLTDFLEYSNYGEASPRIMYWVGVSTIAGALRRKIWFDQDIFQWSPNFYIIIVGPAGTVKKSTSIDIGINLLKQIEGINFGPEMLTWQALITYIAEHPDTHEIGSEDFISSNVTIAISEFGTFFELQDRSLVDSLTNLWDGKLGTIEKLTKTQGGDSMVNPWINIISGTTPEWMMAHFPNSLIGSGFAGRCIFLHGEMSDRDIPYPKRNMPKGKKRNEQRNHLVSKLQDISNYAGAFDLTEQAYEWGDAWYKKQRNAIRKLGVGSLEAGFVARKQVHLHKLAMVIAASKYKFPVVDVEDLVEADIQLRLLDEDVKKIFGFVGQSSITHAASQIIEAVIKFGQIEKRTLYREEFFRTMNALQFKEAVDSAIQTGLICEVGDLNNLILAVKGK